MGEEGKWGSSTRLQRGILIGQAWVRLSRSLPCRMLIGWVWVRPDFPLISFIFLTSFSILLWPTRSRTCRKINEVLYHYLVSPAKKHKCHNLFGL